MESNIVLLFEARPVLFVTASVVGMTDPRFVYGIQGLEMGECERPLHNEHGHK